MIPEGIPRQNPHPHPNKPPLCCNSRPRGISAHETRGPNLKKSKASCGWASACVTLLTSEWVSLLLSVQPHPSDLPELSAPALEPPEAPLSLYICQLLS